MPIVPIVVGNYSQVLHVPSMTFEGGTIDIRGGFLQSDVN